MIREIFSAEIEIVAKVWYRSGVDEYDYLPRFRALDEKQAIEIFRDVILPDNQLWVEDQNAVILGFLAQNDSYIDRLYVDPDCQRKGVGSGLLDHAKALSPEGLQLHTHQQNLRARSFYEKHGFTAMKFGLSPAPELVPDVEYHWTPPQ
jgi:ribosomal protein S18 acetylase RimI-like enzyme